MKNCNHLFLISLFILVSTPIVLSQTQFEVEGEVKLGKADTLSSFDHIVVRKADGVLGVTPVNNLTNIEAPKGLPYIAGWRDYNRGFQNGTYYKHQERVYLDGTILQGGLPDTFYTESDTLCRLPIGYRPRKKMIL